MLAVNLDLYNNLEILKFVWRVVLLHERYYHPNKIILVHKCIKLIQQCYPQQLLQVMLHPEIYKQKKINFDFFFTDFFNNKMDSLMTDRNTFLIYGVGGEAGGYATNEFIFPIKTIGELTELERCVSESREGYKRFVS